jgi:5'-nucleotidase
VGGLRCSLLTALTVVAALAPVSPALARNILITNDDGLTSNVRYLHDALKAQGHDVIVVVPCQQQSGMGGALQIMKPLGPIAADCINGAARKGDPGAGPMTRHGLGPDYHYVDGTPVMATLYGLDVAGQARWGKAPDLVISGPNIGRNVGGIVVSSGTVSNVQYALMRAVPAIAVSAGMNTESGPDLVNAQSEAVSRRVLELVSRLEASAPKGPLLPAATALNINFPDDPRQAPWKLTRIGNTMAYDLRFVADLRPAAARQGSPLPGLTFRILPADKGDHESRDEASVASSAIAVSVMQLAYDAPAPLRSRAANRLKGLLTR